MRLLIATALIASTLVSAQTRRPRPLTAEDVGDIAQFVMLEDTRRFDDAALARMLKSAHAEVRRRAALSIGRIADPRGGALLATARGDKEVDVAATVVFATGQLRDPASIPWLSEILSSLTTPPAVAREAAIALGKVTAPDARGALARYLLAAPATPRAAPVVGEALLSLGRFPPNEDLSPILRWTGSRDINIRWRATWALFRPRHPAALPHLLPLTNDPSGDVRFWAVRGLVPPPPQPPVAFDRAAAAARLREAVRDPDRRVRTEALRALAQHDDDESFAVVLDALDSPDSWLSVSAAEALGRSQVRRAAIVPRLLTAAAPAKPLALRLTALGSLTALSPEAAVDLASVLARDTSAVARVAVRQALGRLGEAGKARLGALTAEGVLPAPPNRPQPSAPAPRTADDSRRLVERWVLPDYNGAKRPRATWDTPRGPIQLELFPGDAPLGVDHFIRVVESGEIVGTEFGRVVPNFVAQQRAIRDDVTLRDEVSRHGLPRSNLSWASAGLDTGRPGYTLAMTPQPHNEGNFTALGRIVAGMDAVERLELGDRITAARMVR